eukprot:SAG22_NODE_6179_length_889_cov_2.216456_2_plen_72_part_01
MSSDQAPPAPGGSSDMTAGVLPLAVAERPPGRIRTSSPAGRATSKVTFHFLLVARPVVPAAPNGLRPLRDLE